MAKKAASKKKSAAKKSAKKPAKKAAKKTAKKTTKKPAKKSAAAKKSASKKKSTAKKPAKKAAKKPATAKKSAAKKSAKKPAKKATKKPAKKAASKSASKKTAAKSGAKKKAVAKKTTSTAKKSAKKSAVGRTAKKVSNKGVLIRLKSKDDATSPVQKKLRQVKAVEKSKGENPINLHHRKPTKKEAEMFRGLLVTRRNQLQGDVNELENEAFSDESKHVSTNHLADGAFEQYEQEFNISMIESETEELKEIARALDKIGQGEYGTCEACGIDISIERLKVMPYTRVCIHCRSKYEEEGGGHEFGIYPERRV